MGYAVLALCVASSACESPGEPRTDSAGSRRTSGSLDCILDESHFQYFGVGTGGIPALTNPELASPGDPATGYLRAADRVVGVELGGRAIAVPFNILWWHEVVNLDGGGKRVAVTRCPLTGSTAVFDRGAIGGRSFGVSGLLYKSNLVLTDGQDPATLFPQMSGGARCGPGTGRGLEPVPFLETSWERWQELHPDTRVVSSRTGWDRNYRFYPYPSNYGDPENPSTAVPVPFVDDRRPPKERVVGLPGGGDLDPLGKRANTGLAFPTGELDRAGPVSVGEAEHQNRRVVVLWERRSRTIAAFRPRLRPSDKGPSAPEQLTLQSDGEAIRDLETGSTWRVDGRAVAGPLNGARLEPIAGSYTAFWFAWALFYPRTQIWAM